MNPQQSLVDESEMALLAHAAHRLDVVRPSLGAGSRAHRHRSGDGSEFRDFDVYRPGDNLRRVDWRVTVRRGQPYVRTYHRELSADWQICIDASASMSVDPTKWLMVQRLGAAFAFLLLHAGHRVGAIAFDDVVDGLCSPGRGRRQFLNVLKMLQSTLPLARGGGSVPATVTGHVRPGTHIVLLSDFLRADGMRSDLVRLLAPGRTVHAVQITSRQDVPDLGGQAPTVQDIESGERLTLNAASSGLARTEFSRLRKELSRFCRKHDIRLTQCDADEAMRDVMLRHLRAVHG